MRNTPKFKTTSKNHNLVFAPTKEHYEAQVWCFNSGFKISYDLLENGTKCRIKVAQGDNISYGKNIYTANSQQANESVWNLYLQIYNKQNVK